MSDVMETETADGIVLTDDYLRTVAQATREVGGLFVLDCIASGALWVDMADLGIDVLITAPQKGWSGSPGAAYVLVNERARTAVNESSTTGPPSVWACSGSTNCPTWMAP